MIFRLDKGLLKKPIRVVDSNANDFKGEWLAIINEDIVAHGKDVGKLIDITRKHFKGKKPEFVRVNKGNIAMY